MPKTLRCDPELLSMDLSGRTYIVTGANSGTGLVTTEQLARQGASAVAACRRVDAGREATEYLAEAKGTVQVMAENRAGGWPTRSPNPLTYDDALAEELYEISLELVGLGRDGASA